jgi:hypothetical protein
MRRYPAMKLKVYTFAGILILVNCLSSVVFAAPPDEGRGAVTPAFLEARIDGSASSPHLKPGDTLRGKIVENVFSGNRLIVPQGSRVSLTISRLERRRKGHSVVLPWPVQYFRPKYAKYPTFDFADVTLPEGARIRLRVTSFAAIEEVRASPKTESKVKSGGEPAFSSEEASRRDNSRRSQGPRYELVVDPQSVETSGTSSAATADVASACFQLPKIKTVDAGTEAKLALLGTLSASKSQKGEPFKALLIEPLRLKSDLMLPEGTIFEGRVSNRTPARRLSRPGSLHLTFNQIILPAGTSLPIAASMAGVGVDKRSPMKLSSEGGLSGGSPGKARLLVELGIGVGISKVADDAYQIIAEAFISSATDASTAGTARLIGLGISGLYWLTRRGRDVTLPPYTTFTIRFDRSPDLPPFAPAP